jgi:hypothetical protein
MPETVGSLFRQSVREEFERRGNREGSLRTAETERRREREQGGRQKEEEE